MAYQSKFRIAISDLKRGCVDRLLEDIVVKDMDRHRMGSKAKRASLGDDLSDNDEKDDDDEESENDKIVRLQEDSKGKPSPIPVVEEDFSEKSVKAAMKNLPAPTKTRKKV